MKGFHGDVPAWPALGVLWVVLAVLVGRIVSLVVVAVVAYYVVGLEEGGAGTAAARSVLIGVVVVGAVLVVAGRTARPAPRQFGLRVGSPRRMVVGALVVGGGAVVVVAAWSLVVDLGALEVPATLDPRSEAAREADLPVRQDIAVDAAFVVTAALVVLGALVSEVVVRGYMFPALAGWCGRWVAGAVVAVIFAALMGGLAVPALLVGAALCVVYLWSGSLLPTITVTAGLGGTLLAGACDFGAAAIALTAVACAASALALALVPTALARTA